MGPLWAIVALALAQPDPQISRQAQQPPSARSFLGGETLGAGSLAASVAVGYPRLTAIYGYGLSSETDLGAVGTLDWLSSELTVGVMGRRHVLGIGRLELATRGRLGFYRNFGASYAVPGNFKDTGALLEAGLALGAPVGAGTLSVGADAPYVVTWGRGLGGVFTPQLGFALEMPILGDLSVGAQTRVGWRFASGRAAGVEDADGRPVVELAAVGTYRVF